MRVLGRPCGTLSVGPCARRSACCHSSGHFLSSELPPAGFNSLGVRHGLSHGETGHPGEGEAGVGKPFVVWACGFRSYGGRGEAPAGCPVLITCHWSWEDASRGGEQSCSLTTKATDTENWKRPSPAVHGRSQEPTVLFENTCGLLVDKSSQTLPLALQHLLLFISKGWASGGPCTPGFGGGAGSQWELSRSLVRSRPRSLLAEPGFAVSLPPSGRIRAAACLVNRAFLRQCPLLNGDSSLKWTLISPNRHTGRSQKIKKQNVLKRGSQDR